MKSSLLAVVGGATTAFAAVRGFNYASNGGTVASFTAQFRTAAGLTGANDYTSARLYTMIQDGTDSTPISAIQAAIDTDTTLLLGLWASQDQAGFAKEITALKAAATQYGQRFADLVQGISVGSEDLYRISATGLSNDPNGVGQTPQVLVDYIRQVREAIQGTVLSTKPVGHVDTWNVYVNGSNSAVIGAADFLGLDEYPYFETTNSNGIDNAKNLFFQAYDKVAGVSQGKPIWITEAGWPVSGPTSNLAVANVQNAETFWQQVACELERRSINTWWYILSDAGASPSFGVSNNGQPLYKLSCDAPSSSSSSTTASSTSAGNSSGSSSSGSSASSTGSGSPTVIPTTTASGSGLSSGGGGRPTSTGAGTSGGAVGPSTTAGTGGSGGSATTSSTTPGYTGAASKTEGSIFALALGAVVAALIL